MLFCTRRDGKVAFGLPGNPASSLISFFLYVVPAIKTYMGHRSPLPEKLYANSDFEYSKKRDRDHLLRTRLYSENGKNLVSLAGRQESNVLLSFHHANSLTRIPGEMTEIKRGTLLEVFPLRFSLLQ